ncbi:hypothetical protein HB779_03130 [Phyllobacterium sp. 628]|uniref:Stf0 family sulfotransferase n=1 Tax=Phyllobacterium sp. 628 TaxID=2718938 RepID=UPI00166239F3|nr:Stf0 family sulfotransferase [Phyllobacterium sp. 628]QND50992.1 hypothetical protein HB779_03130 [Phyllobacterium sp. 628]
MSSAKLRGFAICTSPRTGSNFVCQLISSTGVLGKPLEYFNWRGRRHFENAGYPDHVAGQINEILSTGCTDNSIYALKLFAHQHDWISGEIAWTKVLPNLSFVYLTRNDLVAQAISWAIALQTGQFRATQTAHGEPVFDAILINQQLRQIIIENARWTFYFARTGIAPLHLIYEDVLADPEGAVEKIAALMGLSPTPIPVVKAVNVSVQRTMMNEAWATRFRGEYGDPDVLLQF